MSACSAMSTCSPTAPPLMAAKAFATLDCLSGGRSIIGLGAGYLEEEFELLGVPFRERGRRFDEGIDELIRGLADDDVDGFVLAPRPVQQPRPPIWIGGLVVGCPPARRKSGRRVAA